MKLNVFKKGIILCPAMVLVFLMSSYNSGISAQSAQSETSFPAEQEVVKIEIKTPSAAESTIAPGRQFKVSGVLSGEIPDDAILRVTHPSFPYGDKTKKIKKGSMNRAKAKTTLRGLKNKTTYYMRVCILDKKGVYSNWSKTVKVKTK